MDQRIKEAEETDARLKLVSADINRKKRKLDHKSCILRIFSLKQNMLFKQSGKRKENQSFPFLHI